MGNWAKYYIQEYRNAQSAKNMNGIPLVRKYTWPQDRNHRRISSIFVDAAYCDKKLSYSTDFAIFYPGGGMIAAGFQRIKPPGSIMAAELQVVLHEVHFGVSDTEGPCVVFH